jgi:putative flippase GtrA
VDKIENELPVIPLQEPISQLEVGWFARLTGHIPPQQFLRYILVGVWNTLFGYSTFAGLYYLLHRHSFPAANVYWQVISAQVVSNLVNISVAFFGYKFFVFKTKGNYLREWLKAMAVYWSGFLPALLLLPLLVKALQYVPHAGTHAPYIANAILLCFGVIYNFFGHKHVTFRQKPTTTTL